MTGQRMTPAALAVFRGGFENAIRLGHRHLGCEHLLLALVTGDHPAAVVLRAHGLRPDRVEEQVARLGGGGIFGGLDESSLSAIGIDLGAVRQRALASFGPEALARAGRAGRCAAVGRRPALGHRRRGAGGAGRPRRAPVRAAGGGCGNRGAGRGVRSVMA